MTVTGASGLIGRPLVSALLARGDEVTVLSRDPKRTRARLQDAGGQLQAVRWAPLDEPAPASALAGADAIVNLAGESIAQRWSESTKRAIRDSRVIGTGNLVAGLHAADPRPRTLVSASGIGYYGAHGEEPLDEETPPARDFLAQVCLAWEAEARRAVELGMRVVQVRTGVVLAASGGALARMLPAFRLGLGGPVAGGGQYVSWIHISDHVALLLAALDDQRYSGPINSTAPAPVTNRQFSSELGRVLRRPAALPVPALALRTLYGEMAELLTAGARVLPAKALMLGFAFEHPELQQALAAVLARA